MCGEKKGGEAVGARTVEARAIDDEGRLVLPPTPRLCRGGSLTDWGRRGEKSLARRQGRSTQLQDRQHQTARGQAATANRGSRRGHGGAHAHAHTRRGRRRSAQQAPPRPRGCPKKDPPLSLSTGAR